MIILLRHMLPRPQSRALFLPSVASAILLLCSSLHAQENCGVEVKLLLAPTETPSALTALGAKKQTAGHLYFFDTAALDLLSQGAIVRLRQGAKTDLTVKLRLPGGKNFSPAAHRGHGFKCEIDFTRDGEIPTYSITKQLAAAELPQTGTDVVRLLSPSQIRLLHDAHISIDWTAVNRIAEIASTGWQTRSQPRLGKLTLELWEWPQGKVLELSTKVSPDTGSSAYAELQQLASTKRLTISPDQRVKTAIALEAITHPPPH